jgi:glycosyltransferase involved in cell wall biosynthesis
MKILYDNQIFTLQKYGGISRYYNELIENISDSYAYDLVGMYCDNKYINRRIRRLGTFTYSPIVDSCLNNRLIKYNVRQNIRSLKLGAFDVFQPTYFDPYFLRYLGKRPFVLMVPDMIYEMFPEYFVDSQATISRKRLLIEKASAIVALSHNTKEDLRKLYDVDEKKITVIYPGPSLSGVTDPALIDRCIMDQLPEKYLLFVGKRGRYKNFDLFVESLAPLMTKYQDLHLVCAGGSPFGSSENELMQKLNIIDKVRQYDVNDETLMELYRRAVAFVFPSHYEGFGFPILEAFSCECPVVLSNSTSLPEVAGDAGLYFDPSDVSSIRSAIGMVLEDNCLRAKLVNRGRTRSRQFTWQKTVGELGHIYKSIANH